jgi:hypothetical protein
MYTNKIEFGNQNWFVKKHRELMGPGNNLYGLHPHNVKVDSKGQLVLAIKKVKNGWSCAEIISESTITEGIYEFSIESDLSLLEPNMVLGLFVYNEANPPYYDEADIEFSRWNNPQFEDAQFVVHQGGELTPYRFSTPTGVKKSIHQIKITKDSVCFQSKWFNKNNSYPITYTHKIVRPQTMSLSATHIRINLWLMEPADRIKRYPKVKISRIAVYKNQELID